MNKCDESNYSSSDWKQRENNRGNTSGLLQRKIQIRIEYNNIQKWRPLTEPMDKDTAGHSLASRQSCRTNNEPTGNYGLLTSPEWGFDSMRCGIMERHIVSHRGHAVWTGGRLRLCWGPYFAKMSKLKIFNWCESAQLFFGWGKFVNSQAKIRKELDVVFANSRKPQFDIY